MTVAFPFLWQIFSLISQHPPPRIFQFITSEDRALYDKDNLGGMLSDWANVRLRAFSELICANLLLNFCGFLIYRFCALLRCRSHRAVVPAT